MTAINFSNALGIHERALHLRVARAEILANNLSNADTPGYKAKDIDFRAALNSQRQNNGSMRMRATHMGHIAATEQQMHQGFEVIEREALQPSVDGNTVDAQRESATFAKNAVEFSASFRLINSRLNGLSKAIKGE